MNQELPLAEAAAPTPPGKPPSETPGGLIRAARERLHLSLDELAGQTKLPRQTLDALERDDFAALLEPVYVRGYYRKCAKVLNIPEAQLMKAYESRVVPRTQVPPAKLRLGTGADMGGGRRLSGVLVIAVLAVLAGVVIWYLRGERAPQNAGALPAQSALSEAPVQVPPAAGMTSPASITEAAVAPPAQPLPATETAQAPKTQNGTAAATGSQLQLNFVSISWARVEDANRRALLNRVVQAGERQVLDGVPPYSVFLGNAPGVEVQYQGAAVDIKALIRDTGTARFSVPLAPKP